MRKAQTWSFDLLIAVVLFIIIVSVFYAFLSTSGAEDKTEELQSGAKAIGYFFNCDVSEYTWCFIEGGKIDEAKLADLLLFINSNPELVFLACFSIVSRILLDFVFNFLNSSPFKIILYFPAAK